jgi:hypothetical protein
MEPAFDSDSDRTSVHDSFAGVTAVVNDVDNGLKREQIGGQGQSSLRLDMTNADRELVMDSSRKSEAASNEMRIVKRFAIA